MWEFLPVPPTSAHGWEKKIRKCNYAPQIETVLRQTMCVCGCVCVSIYTHNVYICVYLVQLKYVN